MANVIQSVYRSLKAEYEPDIKVRYPYVYDESKVPYIYMYEVDDQRLKNYLCDSDGGDSRITIGYLSTRFADCVDQLDVILLYTRELIGSIFGVEITRVNSGNTRDITEIDIAQKKIYRREFDSIFSWSK